MPIVSETGTAFKGAGGFMDENFLLETESARILFHEFASKMPIIDYHCHLPPDEIAQDKIFPNLTQIWLYGDHYKWRAMRSNGIDESYCTGNKPDNEKFRKWAETVPYTMRNPLYHWTHLELRRYFDEYEILGPANADRIYKTVNEKLNIPEYSVRSLLKKMDVRVVCTTDDPLDSLEYHQQIKAEGIDLQVLPTFRPDKFILIENPAYTDLISRLGNIVNRNIESFHELTASLKQRAEFFASLGGRLADHGLERISSVEGGPEEADKILKKRLTGQNLSADEVEVFKSALLHELGIMYHALGWTQQFHLGAMRNNNRRALRTLGPDTGWDSIGDYAQAGPLSRFLGRLDEHNQLAQTVIYNLNPSDNETMATMVGNFNDGSVAGKVQFGSGWWFMDQKNGMENQMNALSNMGLLSRFVGMLTDSRSFLSFPRHEYFRRILCNLYGKDIANGELPNDIAWIGETIQNICYNNAKAYFKF